MDSPDTSCITLSLSELIDRLSVNQIKEVLAPHGKESFGRDNRMIEDELERILPEAGLPRPARFIRLIIALAQINLHIWKEKEWMQGDPSRYDAHLKLSHQLNGLRNQLKNALLQEAGIRQMAKTNTDTDNLAGWCLSILRTDSSELANTLGLPPLEKPGYAYLITDLIDTLTIHQIKEAFFTSAKRETISSEMERITGDVEMRLREKNFRLTGGFIGLVVLLAQANLHVWLNKDLMQTHIARYGELLDFAQDLNGLRNHVRNIMMYALGESAPCNLRVNFLSHDGGKWYSPLLARLPLPAQVAPESFPAITFADLKLYFGIDEQELSENCKRILETCDLCYRWLHGDERDEVIRKIVLRLDSGDFWVSGADKKHIWEKGWGENLDEYEQSKDILTLMPKFLQAKKVLRMGRNFIEPQSPNFEFDIVDIYRRCIFQKYLADVDAVFEFGCGSCQHLPVLVELFPDKAIHGLDWAEASQKIIAKLVHDKGWNITGHAFNLFEPDDSLELSHGAGVITLGTMEQTGKNFEPFLQFLIRKRPAVVCHIESMLELYDENNLCDCLARIYDRKRNYLDGYIDRLRALEKEHVIEIMEIRRVYFGSMFHDSYSMVAWRPRS